MVVAIVTLAVGALVSYNSYREVVKRNIDLTEQLVEKRVEAGEAVVLNCQEPYRVERVRSEGWEGSPGGIGEFLVACSPRTSDDGVHFAIDVGNPNHATYHRVTFTVRVKSFSGDKQELAWQNVLTDPSKPGVFIVEELGPGAWQSFEFCPPLDRCPMEIDVRKTSVAMMLSGLQEVSVAPHVLTASPGPRLVHD